MQSLSQRAQPRVKYPADVRLIAPALQREVAGKSLNVSTSGIFVEAKELVDIGTELWCDLPLPGGTRRLAGKVARLQPLPFSSERVGLGIRFVDLDEIARTLISNLVTREGTDGHLAEASFEGMEGAIRSQAVLTRDGARLTAALTFLRPGAEVKIAFLSGPSKVASKGVVRETAIEGRTLDGAPRLSVEVELMRQPSIIIEDDEDPEEVTAVDTPRALQAANMVAEAARTAKVASAPDAGSPLAAPRALDRSGRRHLEHRGRPRHSATVAVINGEHESSARDTLVGHRPRNSRPLVKLGLAGIAALACFALGGMSARLWPRPMGEPVSAERLVLSLPVQPAVPPAAPAPPTPPPASPNSARAVAVAPAPPVATAPAPVAEVPVPSPAEAPASAAPAAPTDRPPAPRLATRTTAPVTRLATSGPPPARARLRRASQDGATDYTELALRSAIPVPEGTPGPALLREGEELVAAVPFDGSSEGWRHYRLSEPRAVAVNLPRGRATLALGRHTFANEGFRGVWIREHEQGGIQIRFTLAYRTPEVLGVEVKDGTLRVRVAPAQSSRAPGSSLDARP